MSAASLVVTIASGIIAGDLDFFPVHIDMAALPDAFWDYVAPDGRDMRALSMNGRTAYPIDIVQINASSQTGHCFVRVPVKGAGSQFRIDIGDPSLAMPDPLAPIGRIRVWAGYGPVWCGFAADLASAWRKQTNWRRGAYPPVDIGADEIFCSGGFLRAGGQYPPNYSQRSGGIIGRRTGGSADAALWSNTGLIVGSDTDRETVYFRSDHTIGLWNNSDGWLSGGAWMAGHRLAIGYTHDDNVERKLYVGGALVGSDSSTFWLPSGGNYKYLGAESNELKEPLTCKISLAYMVRQILPADWYAFEQANWFSPGTTLSYIVTDNVKVLDMSVLFAGTSIADVKVSGSNVPAETSSGNIDTYVVEAVRCGGDGSVNWVDIDFAATADIWFASYMRMTGSGNANTQLALFSAFNTTYSTATPLFQVDADGTPTANLEYWNGSAQVSDAAVDFNLYSTTKKRIDVHILMSDTVGKFELYVDGALSATLTTSDTIRTTATNIDRIRLRSPNTDTISCDFSGFMVADEDTRGMRIVQRLPTSNGAETQWTGGFGDIDETGYSDVDFITTSSANQTSTFNFADLPSEFANSPIAAVVIAERVQGSAVSPTTIQNVARVSSTDYPDDTEHAVTTSFGPAQTIFAVNPATLAEWTASAVNAAEFGVKSKT